MFLDGYRQVTSYPVSSDTGLALALFMVFIFTFDQEFERARHRGDSHTYQELTETARVSEIWMAMEAYLREFDRDEVILTHLRATFAANFEQYCSDVTAASHRPEFALTLRLAEQDSGMTLRTCYEIIRLFNDHRSHPECARQFYGIGMAGKFLDDIRDMVDDVTAGEPNLLHSLVAGHARERVAVEEALASRTRIDLSWWQRTCPDTLHSFFEYTFRYYDLVPAAKLRLPLDICHSLLYSRWYWRRPIHRSPTEVH
ncbi:hypothetical protein [Nocardia sp. CA-119907]|uniref:hypothetical protein n=1 Tax=Nocardia sp. CA-119907 TaxID=3239973 RepID=UPI003D981397